MKSKSKFYVKTIRIIVKYNMAQTVLSFDQKTFEKAICVELLCFLP